MTLTLQQYVWLQMGVSVALLAVAASARVRSSLLYYLAGWAALGWLIRHNATAVFKGASWSGGGFGAAMKYVFTVVLVVPFAILSILYFFRVLSWLGSGAPRRTSSGTFQDRIDTLESSGNLVEAIALLDERVSRRPKDVTHRRRLIRLCEKLRDWQRMARHLEDLADRIDDPEERLSLYVRAIDTLADRLKDRPAAASLAEEVLECFTETDLHEQCRALLVERKLVRKGTS